MSADKRMNAAEIAAETGMCKWTILDWAKAGKIPCVRISPRTIRFDKSKVLKALGLEDEVVVSN
ncbi:hypothetical protein SAMN05444166_5670 [Singulisphaera sp. GP187]|uniref:helix-turn-helix domain-containing protein n=1 Tax=Singulisphaera sp. GP187 TaxID=1882752 RepID=UPI0009258BD7|nr:helix-turn-helix domain-containing protein [Singulisphaera sp. GP187]SIO58413.1 hypothetical protein SAMN05444166_5670 [Singulisphaera sp. GP187]